MHDIPSDPRRLEAFARYEQCLADRRTILMEGYIEHLLVQQPVPLELMEDIIGDLHHHLLTLRHQHFDMRERIIDAMQSIYQVDITPLTPSNHWYDYHLLDVDQVMVMVLRAGFYLGDLEANILRDMIVSSTRICARLIDDIDLTERICAMIHDWLMAYLPLQSEPDLESALRVQ